MTAPTCALWYWRNFAMTFDLADTEEVAASFAVHLEDQGEGVPVGVQFADGRLLPVSQWQAYHDRYREVRAQEDAELAAKKTAPPRPTRVITDPFEGRDVRVYHGDPDWLGARAEASERIE